MQAIHELTPPPLLDYAKRLKLRCREGDLDLPERRKRYTSSREEGVATECVPVWHNNRE